jgi:hypothetical protein
MSSQIALRECFAHTPILRRAIRRENPSERILLEISLNDTTEQIRDLTCASVVAHQFRNGAIYRVCNLLLAKAAAFGMHWR